MPQVKPLDAGPDAKVRQPKYPFRALPAHSILVGTTGAGKSLTLIRTLMDKDKLGGMFDRFMIQSPNIFVDPQYKALIDYIEKTTGQRKDDFCFEEFDSAAIRQLMEDQKKSNAYLRKIGAKRLISACIVIDDFGERADLVRAHSSVINSLFSRGRHLQISAFLLLQRFRMAGPTIRYNSHNIYCHRINNAKDIQNLAEEFGETVGGEDVFVQMYRRATSKRFGFLFITTGAEPHFFSSYESEFRIKAKEKEQDDSI